VSPPPFDVGSGGRLERVGTEYPGSEIVENVLGFEFVRPPPLEVGIGGSGRVGTG